MKSILPTQLLIALHLLLLLRQSLLLLRPQWDQPQQTGPGNTGNTAKSGRLATGWSQRLRRWCRPDFMPRIQQHGSGAALAALPLLTLLLYPPKDWLSYLQAERVWLTGLGILAAVALAGLLATRFQHFNGIAFSSRDAGPADFGRRWPLWPDGVLWLCELGYLSLLYILLLRLPALSASDQRLLLPVLAAVHALFYYTVWRNGRAFYRQFIRRTRPALLARVRQLEALPLTSPQRPGTDAKPFYLLRLELRRAKGPNNSSGLPSLPMGFFMLQFPGLKLPRWQQNEHPVSLLGQHHTTNADNQRVIELEFALEMQGFLQYLDPAEIVWRTIFDQVRLWGPYYDAQPQFLCDILQSGHLLYIGYGAGLSPLIQWLQYLSQPDQPGSCQMRIAVLQLQAASSAATDRFWHERLQQASRAAAPGLNLELRCLSLPAYLEAGLNLHVWPQAVKSLKAGHLSRQQRRRLGAWKSFRAERESEILAEILQRQLQTYLNQLCREWQVSLAELRENCLYRGPYSMRKQVEQCFEEAR